MGLTTASKRNAAFPSAKGQRRPVSILEKGELPVSELAAMAVREGKRQRPIYGIHKWFARRAGSAFRALLVAAASDANDDFWSRYYDASLEGWTVLDPFVGGGTSVVEAQRLGAQVIGIDIDPVACAVSSVEVRAASLPPLDKALDDLKQEVASVLAPYYTTVGPEGDERTVLHFFWVQEVDCGQCKQKFEAHPNHRLAFQAEGSKQWVFCPSCHTIEELDRRRKRFTCRSCASAIDIETGAVEKGRCVCPSCSHGESLIEYARRTRKSPRWRMFALETITGETSGRAVPLAKRTFQPATDADRARYRRASSALKRRLKEADRSFIPTAEIPTNVQDTRLRDYGYQTYAELFNDRQLLHLSLLAAAIHKKRGRVREALAVAFSDHLTTNCMMTCYASGWRRLVPLFAIRGFRHIPRPVEINPWLDGTGRGTFPNAIRQIGRAREFALNPTDQARNGGFVDVPAVPGPAPIILNGDAKSLIAVDDASVDFVLTDPPYLDNIAYSELSDFFQPWLAGFGLVKRDASKRALRTSLAASSRSGSGVDDFAASLGEAFSEIARVLKPEGIAALTYRHHEAEAWRAFGEAAQGSGLECIQAFPLLAEGTSTLHTHEGSTLWDVVLVFRKTDAPLSPLTRDGIEWARGHTADWRAKVKGSCQPFRKADELNFLRASIVAASLGALNCVGEQVELEESLKDAVLGVLVPCPS